jgi:hypothetical protein
MANSQHAIQPNTDMTQSFTYQSEPSNIELEHVCVSQLLGRDYIFINSQAVDLRLNNPTVMHSLLDELIQQLELAETHTVAVSVTESHDGTPSFIRHDLTWYKHKICRVESIAITQAEQYEFMEMIWRCSTAALPA